MSLIKSISGIRGTIGGRPGESLTPVDIVKFTSAYGTWLGRRHRGKKLMVVIGRDARRSGSMVSSLVSTTLRSLGIDVTDIGLASTPTVELVVTGTGSHGGIIITASHNPAEWNALKLLNERGEFRRVPTAQNFSGLLRRKISIMHRLTKTAPMFMMIHGAAYISGRCWRSIW